MGCRMKYSPWIKRMIAQQIDMAVALPFLALFLVSKQLFSGAVVVVIGVVALLGYAGTTYYNRCHTMGRTGWSWGKMLMGIRVVEEGTGRPTGVPRAIVREFAHTADMVTVVGIMLPLFPRWDRKGQTFADKIMKTVVVDQPWNRSRKFEPARPEAVDASSPIRTGEAPQRATAAA
jgi:uncharacterized RDD family membrane protein YckC